MSLKLTKVQKEELLLALGRENYELFPRNPPTYYASAHSLCGKGFAEWVVVETKNVCRLTKEGVLAALKVKDRKKTK
jgi:hypothetical protein